MPRIHRAFLAITLACLPLAAAAQFLPQRYRLTDAERRELTAGRDRLREEVLTLRQQSERTGRPAAEQLPDAEIWLDGVDRVLRQELFFAARDVELARASLKEGRERVRALTRGEAPWERRTGRLVLGYRSRVDGSVQPYQVLVPEGYRAGDAQPGPLHIFLHGRSGNLSEVNFLTQPGWIASSFGTAPLPYLVLFPYGRGNNGWRWAGERDLFEALADLERRFRVDPERIYLRGFSMGGHGTWHVGLQHPGRWAAMSPGAGFTDTKIYQDITEQLPEWQEKLLHMYDPVDYTANAENLPVLAYAGDQDPAFGQHRLIVDRLRAEKAPFTEYIGPQTPHRYEPAVLAKILGDLGQHRREPAAERVRFVTYTLRWPGSKWVRLEGLEHHWERAEIRAEQSADGRVTVETRNLTAIELSPPREVAAVRVDGSDIPGIRAGARKPLSLVKTGNGWRVGELRGERKKPGLQGPIDDALFGPVVAVSGTGTPWSEPLERWSGQELRRFREGWDEYFRATLPERTDRTLTAADAREKNLYLFGDPGSNAVLRRLLPRLPLRWTRDSVTVAGKTYSTRDHVPVLVYPNPENPERYVVINCGFTWSRADWQGSNARQYSHLPDYAVLRFDPERYSDDHRKSAVLAGFFDERWRIAEP